MRRLAVVEQTNRLIDNYVAVGILLTKSGLPPHPLHQTEDHLLQTLANPRWWCGRAKRPQQSRSYGFSEQGSFPAFAESEPPGTDARPSHLSRSKEVRDLCHVDCCAFRNLPGIRSCQSFDSIHNSPTPELRAGRRFFDRPVLISTRWTRVPAQAPESPDAHAHRGRRARPDVDSTSVAPWRRYARCSGLARNHSTAITTD